jgi:hypothetical protein
VAKEACLEHKILHRPIICPFTLTTVDEGIARTALAAGNFTLRLLGNESLLNSTGHSPSMALAEYSLQEGECSNLAKSKCHKLELLFGVSMESFCQQRDHSMIIASLYLDGVGLASLLLVVADG